MQAQVQPLIFHSSHKALLWVCCAKISTKIKTVRSRHPQRLEARIIIWMSEKCSLIIVMKSMSTEIKTAVRICKPIVCMHQVSPRSWLSCLGTKVLPQTRFKAHNCSDRMNLRLMDLWLQKWSYKRQIQIILWNLPPSIATHLRKIQTMQISSCATICQWWLTLSVSGCLQCRDRQVTVQ